MENLVVLLRNTYIDAVKLGTGLIILMAVNITLGAASSLFESGFELKKLFKGIGKALVLTFCFAAVYAAGILNKDTLSIDLGINEPVDIVDAMHALLLAGYFAYARQVLQKMGSIVKVPPPDETGEITDEIGDVIQIHDGRIDKNDD